MLEPFLVSDKVGCVLGRQHARFDAVPCIKREVNGVFGSMCSPDSILLHRDRSLVDDMQTNDTNTFFSDVNSAVRRSLLLGDIPFRDVSYAEDQSLAKDMQSLGHLKGYAPLGEVWHSNEYTAREFRKRKFDEFIGLQDSVGYKITPSMRSLSLGWVRPTIADWKFIARDVDYRKRLKLRYILLAPVYNFMSGSASMKPRNTSTT
jgi:rhamnosyltransferase